MTTPTDQPSPFSRLFDIRINLTSILALGTIVYGLGYGYSKYETREDHATDMKIIEQTFVRQDISKITNEDLKGQMDRIEKKLDAIERAHQNR
jgi:Tfp pilus assembly protein PilO